MGKKRKIVLLLAAFCLLLAGIVYAAGEGWTTKVHMEQGGDAMTVESGGAITVKSGGSQEFESGSTLDINSATISAGSADTRAAVNAAMGASTPGSLYLSSAGEVFVCVDDDGTDTSWQKVTTSAVD